MCLQASNLAPKMGRQRPARQLAGNFCRVSSGRIKIVLSQNMLFSPREIKPLILKLTIRRSQRTLLLFLLSLAAKKKPKYSMYPLL